MQRGGGIFLFMVIEWGSVVRRAGESDYLMHLQGAAASSSSYQMLLCIYQWLFLILTMGVALNGVLQYAFSDALKRLSTFHIYLCTV